MEQRTPRQPPARKSWKRPRLTVHGSLVDLTGVRAKSFGPTDGFFFCSIAIADPAS